MVDDTDLEMGNHIGSKIALTCSCKATMVCTNCYKQKQFRRWFLEHPECSICLDEFSINMKNTSGGKCECLTSFKSGEGGNKLIKTCSLFFVLGAIYPFAVVIYVLLRLRTHKEETE